MEEGISLCSRSQNGLRAWMNLEDGIGMRVAALQAAGFLLDGVSQPARWAGLWNGGLSGLGIPLTSGSHRTRREWRIVRLRWMRKKCSVGCAAVTCFRRTSNS